MQHVDALSRCHPKRNAPTPVVRKTDAIYADEEEAAYAERPRSNYRMNARSLEEKQRPLIELTYESEAENQDNNEMAALADATDIDLQLQKTEIL